MPRAIAASILLAAPALAACGAAALAPPPSLFPLAVSWSVPLSGPFEGPLASDGERVFVVGRDGVLLAIDAATGAIRWRTEATDGRLAAEPGRLVLRQPRGRVDAFDPATGERLWSAETGLAGDLPPVLAGNAVLVAGDGLVALEMGSGREYWRQPGPPAVTAAPVPWGPWILVGEQGGGLRCRDAATGASLWATALGGEAQKAPPVVDDDRRAYLGTTARGFECRRLDDRGKRCWRWKLGADVVTPAALFPDRVVFASYENVLYGLKRSSGDLLWRAPLPSRPLSAPLVSGSAVIVACQERDLVAFDVRSGERLGGVRTPSGLRTAPILVGGQLVAGLRNPWAVVALATAAPEPTAPAATEPGLP